MKRARLSSRVILVNLAKCVLVFYAVYYTISSVCFALYRLSDFDGKIPFDFETWIHLPDCCTQFSSQQTVNFISMEVSYGVSGLVYGVMVRERVWDYALTVAVLHTTLSCLVMLDFPLNWSWWVCNAFAVLLMIVIGEMAALVLRLKFQNKVNPGQQETDQQKGYLYRNS